MPTHEYTVRDVERVLGLSRSMIRTLIDAGFVTPVRGPRQQYRFSFQDLIVLRAARSLLEANVSKRRIRRSLTELRRRLPEAVPLCGLSIGAIGDRIVVRDGTSQFQADDGQYVLGFDVSVEKGVLRVVERKPAHVEGPTSEGWFTRGLELEETDWRAACDAYERAVASDPTHVGAWINWGRLLHEHQQLHEAEKVYRHALDAAGADAVLLFNLGVLLEDLGRNDAAMEAYQAAIEENPSLADCHYNLARLYEAMGQSQHAIRHLGHYRRLIGEKSQR